MSHTVQLLLDHVDLPNGEFTLTAGAKVVLSDEDYGKIESLAFGRTLTDAETKHGSSTVKSASGKFDASDLGKLITLPGFNRGARIIAVNSATEVTVGRIARSSQNENVQEPFAATTDGTGVTAVVGVLADA